MPRGSVKWFDDRKGYGFIAREGGKDIFVHFSAIQGNGFFAVQTPEGVRYTRVGRFQLDQDGTLITSHGYPVLASGGSVTLDPNDGPVLFGEDGSISTEGIITERIALSDVVDGGFNELVDHKDRHVKILVESSR